MSNVSKNPLVRKASGKFSDDFVYRTRGKKTTIAKLPVFDPNAEKTEKQLEVRELFAAAAMYAQGAITSEDLKKEYQKKTNAQNTAYNIAFRDFLKAPKVRSINSEDYTGAIGSTIVVRAIDDFRVAAVKVSIRTSAGVLIEEGNAILNPIFRERWTYTATQNNAVLAGTVITATAQDLPENKTTLEVVMP